MLRYLEQVAYNNADDARDMILDAAKLEDLLAAERRLLERLGINPQTPSARPRPLERLSRSAPRLRSAPHAAASAGYGGHLATSDE
jgi:hypothetical protein